MASLEELRQSFLRGDTTEFPGGVEDSSDGWRLPVDETSSRLAMLPPDFSDKQQILYIMARGLYDMARANAEEMGTNVDPDEAQIMIEAQALANNYWDGPMSGSTPRGTRQRSALPSRFAYKGDELCCIQASDPTLVVSDGGAHKPLLGWEEIMGVLTSPDIGAATNFAPHGISRNILN